MPASARPDIGISRAASPRCIGAALFQPVVFDFIEECLVRNVQCFGGLSLVPVVQLQNLPDFHFLGGLSSSSGYVGERTRQIEEVNEVFGPFPVLKCEIEITRL